jgi:hypothetical protein
MAIRRCEKITVITAEALSRREKILYFLTSAPLRLRGDNDSGDFFTASYAMGYVMSPALRAKFINELMRRNPTSRGKKPNYG